MAQINADNRSSIRVYLRYPRKVLLPDVVIYFGARSECQRYRITPTQMPESATLKVG